jgi:hypothetical protein
MSTRNTGLFVPGHVDPASLGESGHGVLRVGHGLRKGKRYTHIGIDSFEKSGSPLFDQLETPESEDAAFALASSLSAKHGRTVLLFCDDELGAGGHVCFEEGEMVSRDIVDGRAYTPVRRGLHKEEVLENLDPSEWVWPLIAEALNKGAKGTVGTGIRDDDDIESLMREAGSLAQESFAPPSSGPPESQVRGRGDRLNRLLKRVQRKLQK